MVARPRPPLDVDHVIEAAVELTRQRGIDGWTLRELATKLGTWPNTISHHVGTREQVCQLVVDRVVQQIDNPARDLGWQVWFRRFLSSGRDVLLKHPGVARRLCRDGPAVPSAMPIMQRGVELLIADGFADQAPRAYSTLVNNAILLVALHDDRVATGRGAGTAARSLQAFAPPPHASPAWQAMHTFLTDWQNDPEGAFASMFEFNLERSIAGLDRLPRLPLPPH